MKAISIKQPWAWLIANGHKTIETRTWNTKYRGEILLVASKKADSQMMAFFKGTVTGANIELGKAVAIAEIVDCRLMTEQDEALALCDVYEGAYSWVFDNVRKIEPFEVKGQLSIYNVDLPVDADYEYQERIAIQLENENASK